MHRQVSGALSAVVATTLCLALAGCGDDDPEGSEPREPSSSSGETGSPAPTDASPTDEEETVPPATGPELAMEAVSLRMPEGWRVDNDDSDIVVVGLADDLTSAIYLSSFPALDPSVSIAQLARSTQKEGGYPPGSILPETTLAGQPAFHLAGPVGGDYSEELGVLHDGAIISVEFVHRDGPRKGWEELLASVLATVELR